MKQDIGTAATRLAENPRISDYDFWRTLKNLDNEIYRISSVKQPIPIEMIRWRAIIRQARSRRGMMLLLHCRLSASVIAPAEIAGRMRGGGAMAETSRHDAWQAGDSYDAYMGRWSRQVAPRFLDWLDPATASTGLRSAAAPARCRPPLLRVRSPHEPDRHRSVGRLHCQARRSTCPTAAREFQVGDAQALDARRDSRDVVVSALVLNFVPDQTQALAEMKRVVPPRRTRRLLRLGLSRRRRRVHARLLEGGNGARRQRASTSRRTGVSPSARRTA